MRYIKIGYFLLEFLKPNVVFEMSFLEFVNMQHFIQKQKYYKLRTKNALLGLWVGTLKNDCHICDQRPPICLNAKFRAKLEFLNWEPNWRAILKNYCPFCNPRTRICLIPKFYAETKILKFGIKNI